MPTSCGHTLSAVSLLSSPLPVAGTPLRVATFAARDAATGKSGVTAAAEIGQPGAPPTEYGVGYVLTDANGKVVGRNGATTTLAATATQPAHYAGSLTLELGTYTLRFGVVDRDGRRGSIVRELQLGAPADAPFEVSDLFIGSLSSGAAIRPSVEPHVPAGDLGLYIELYPAQDDSRWSVQFEVGEGEQSPVLASARADMAEGARPLWRIASGRIDTALAPGRYVVRARTRRGDSTVAVVARPFVLERNPARPPDSPVISSAGHPDLPRRTAAYVNGFILGMSNVVAQEDFTSNKKRVRSDFLLVRHPGSLSDLLAYRDVYQVDGNMLPGREQRLADLFIKPANSIRERVREIQLDGEQHVPAMFNPLFVVSFLQGSYHQQFRFTVADAKAPWADGVREVSFVETARPTLLRAGRSAQLDVPSRGIAWIEEATGRVLKTELEIGQGRRPAIVVTTFRLDDRLQVMVPDRMETRNPDGLATYSNFRRFSVSAEASVK